MADDVRFTPRYQFWVMVILSILFGVGVGVISFYASRELPWTSLFAGSVGSLIGAGIAGLMLRNRPRAITENVEPYYHPVLGIWLAAPAFLVGFLLTGDPFRSCIFAILGGAAWSLTMLLARLWRTRKDLPNNARPVPTFTGWRDS